MMNAKRGRGRQQKIFEPKNREELLRGWLLHAHKGRDRHDLAARRNDTHRYWLGVPAIALSAIAGTSVFASLQAQVDPWLKIVVGLVSITAAVLASLQTFYNFPSLAESHRLAGAKYKALIQELEQALTRPLEELPADAGFYDSLRKRLADLEVEAPVVPEGIYDQVEARYEDVRIVETVDELVRRAQAA